MICRAVIAALSVALAAAVAVASIQALRLRTLQRDVAVDAAARAEATREAERMASRKVEGVAHDTHAQLTRARADAAAAGSELERLRLALRDARDAYADACTATGGAPAAGPCLVLPDMLSGAAGRAVELAAAADAARAAGLGCERAYEAVTGR